MRHLPTILALLSIPAGLLGYALGAWLIGLLSLPEPMGGILTLFVPLLVAGLVMVPLIAPFIDRMAKRDLAARPRPGSQERGGTDRKRRR